MSDTIIGTQPAIPLSVATILDLPTFTIGVRAAHLTATAGK